MYDYEKKINAGKPKYLVMEYNYPTAFVVEKEDYEPDYDMENVEFIEIKTGKIEH